jgi:hypothetical protein
MTYWKKTISSAEVLLAFGISPFKNFLSKRTSLWDIEICENEKRALRIK